ncbi:Cohesin subunit psc3 [Astathelohania contejeani]|uniref:Cohesin subunit psc3 n=1 Tax=Astathelohania contejeani TaxID=164912 RepID=A0ABQ7HYY2_9MICR|nr:Cohesin subunit psc3 [Thelohania contejeani]
MDNEFQANSDSKVAVDASSGGIFSDIDINDHVKNQDLKDTSLDIMKNDPMKLIEYIENGNYTNIKNKKIHNIFCDITPMPAILHLTINKRRDIRNFSTSLLLSKIKALCKSEIKETNRDFIRKEINDLYEGVFKPRKFDIDHNIRSMCIEYLYEWIRINPKLFYKQDQLEHIGLSLSDKHEVVRRKAIRLCNKIITLRVNISPLQIFFEKFKHRIIEISLYDKSHTLRNESKNLCMNLFDKSFINKSDLYEILKDIQPTSKNEQSNLIKKVLKKILYETNNFIYTFHEIFVSTNNYIISLTPVENKQIIELVDFVWKFYKENEICNCKDNQKTCYLKILSSICIPEDIESTIIDKIYALLITLKDDPKFINEVIQIFLKMTIYREIPDLTREIVEKLEHLIILYKNIEMTGYIMKFYKKIDQDYSSLVKISINNLIKDGENTIFRDSLLIQIIQNFDISSSIKESDCTLLKCYSVLWCIINKDFSTLENIKFEDLKDFDLVCDFVVFFKEKVDSFGIKEPIRYCVDYGSAFRFIYDRLVEIIKYRLEECVIKEKKDKEMDMTKKEHLFSFIKLFKNNILDEYLWGIIDVWDDKLTDQFVIEYFTKANKEFLVNQYFKFLRNKKKNKNKELIKIITGRIKNSNLIFKNVFDLLKEGVLSSNDNVDEYFNGFSNSMSENECIVLENLVPNGKFKDSLKKKIKRNAEFRTSPISSNNSIQEI